MIGFMLRNPNDTLDPRTFRTGEHEAREASLVERSSWGTRYWTWPQLEKAGCEIVKVGFHEVPNEHED